MPFEFKQIRRVEFAETDMGGIMHFANYFRLVEETEHAFYRSLGLSVHPGGAGEGLGWPRVSASFDFKAPLRFEEEVEIHLLVEKKGTRSISYLFVLRKVGGEGAQEVARGRVTAVCVSFDREAGKLAAIPIPPEFSDQIENAPPDLIAAFGG